MLPKENNQFKREPHSVNVPNMTESYNNNKSGGFENNDALVTCTINTAIGHLFEAINLIDLSAPRYIYISDADSKPRSKIFDAISVLRTLAPNNAPHQTHINQLPDECLVLIFEKQFSMQTQIGKLRAVCHRWKFAIETLVCAPKQSLKLFACQASLLKYAKKLIKLNLHRVDKFKLRKIGGHDHDLVLSRCDMHFDVNFFIFLGALFPNVQHLVVGVHWVSDSNQHNLAHIVQQWPNLKHLSLFIKLSRNVSKLSRSVLYRTINSLSSLKSLDLLGQAFQSGIAQLLSNVLPRLKHLALESYDPNNDRCGPVLAKLNPTNLVSLRLDDFDYVVDNLENVFASKMNTKALRVSNVATRLGQVKSICSMFPYLTKLELDFDCTLDTFCLDGALITTLNRLTHLRDLSLANIGVEIEYFQNRSSHYFLPKSRVTSLYLSNLYMFPLGVSNDRLLTKVLAAMFPALKHLEYQFGIIDLDMRFGHALLQSFEWSKSELSEKYFHTKIASLRSCVLYYWHCANEYLGRHQQKCECNHKYLEHHLEREEMDYH